jgi:hypothetical protein
VKGLAGLLLVTTAYADGVAPAKDPDPNAPPQPATEPAPVVAQPKPSTGSLYYHDGQIGVSARVGLGLRGIATYSDKDYCGTTSGSTTTGNAPVCIGREPIALDLEMAYGLGKRVDVLLEMRLGIERDFASSSTNNNGPHVVRLSPGIRYFFSESKSTKLFTTAQAMFDFSDYKDVNNMGRGNDIGLRNLSGLWLDFHRAYGVYFFAGETLGFARWLDFELELGIGIQGRYP